MARKKKAEIGIYAKVPRLSAKDRERLRKALRTVCSIMDAHDLRSLDLPDVQTHYKHVK